MGVTVAEFAGEQYEWEDRSWFPPGPQLAICLSGGNDRLSGLSDAELLEVAAAARRQTSWAQARELDALAELYRRRVHDGGTTSDDPDYRTVSAHESVVDEVAAALTVTGNAAATLVDLADRLSRELPATRRALATGRIDLARVRVISDLTDRLGEGIPEQVEAAVLDKASEQTTGQLRRRVKRVVERLAPVECEERAQESVTARRLVLWEAPSGTSDLALCDIDPASAAAIYNKISAAAHGMKKDGDDRRIDQIRADLATHLLRGLPLSEAVQAHLLPDATVSSAETHDVPRISETVEEDSEATDQGTVQHLAQIFDQRLERIVLNARAQGGLAGLRGAIVRAVDEIVQRLAPGHPCHGTSHNHPGYRPPAAMRQQIERRHTTCAFPSCNQPSTRGDLDHTIPWPRGATCPCNLAPLCRRHHRLKQTPGWKLVQPWPGLLIWITPSGQWHITLPERC